MVSDIKVKAFTIFELLVVLVITSVIIGFGFLIYLQIEKYLNQKLINNPLSIYEIWFLDEMETEIRTCDILIGDRRELKLSSKNGLFETIYEIQGDRIVRFSELRKDSIFISVNIEYIQYNEIVPEFIDRIDFSIKVFNYNRNLVLCKKYFPDVLINNLTLF